MLESGEKGTKTLECSLWSINMVPVWRSSQAAPYGYFFTIDALNGKSWGGNALWTSERVRFRSKSDSCLTCSKWDASDGCHNIEILQYPWGRMFSVLCVCWISSLVFKGHDRGRRPVCIPLLFIDVSQFRAFFTRYAPVPVIRNSECDKT